MDIKIALKMLEQSSHFTEWRSKNKNNYFSYAFKIPQEMAPDDWQIGFYDKKRDKITTFVIEGNNIGIRQDEEIFKKEDTKVNEVQINKVKLTLDSALKRADEFQKKNFPGDGCIKTIAILQNISNLGSIWNITYITEKLNTLSMKIDAFNGKVLEHNISPLISFAK